MLKLWNSFLEEVITHQDDLNLYMLTIMLLELFGVGLYMPFCSLLELLTSCFKHPIYYFQRLYYDLGMVSYDCSIYSFSYEQFLPIFSPWCEAPYRDAAERTTQRNLTLKGFLAEVCFFLILSLPMCLRASKYVVLAISLIFEM